MEKLPNDLKYAEAYLTFRCGLGCEYCINHDLDLEARAEMRGQDWIDALNRFDWHLPITLGGGEPTMHPDFYNILFGLRDDINVDLLTNLSFDVHKFVKKTTPDRFSKGTNPAYKAIRVSYHPHNHNPHDLVQKVRFLQDRGYSIGLFGLNHPHNLEQNVQMSEIARNMGVYFFIKDFLGWHDGQLFGYFKYPKGLDRNETSNVECKSFELLIAPDGNVHKCHRDLYKNEYPLGHISEHVPEIEFRGCSAFGECNPCDLKMKANRFLEAGNCSVEIKDD